MNEILENNQLDTASYLLIKELENQLKNQESQLDIKDKQIAQLENELSYLKGQILKKNIKIFGTSSEQMPSDQLSFFNEAEDASDAKTEEPTIESISYIRNKSKEVKEPKDNLANLERVVVEHAIESPVCNICESPMKLIGKKTKEILKYIPAKLLIEEHVSYSYSCATCAEESDEANIITAKAPTGIIPKSMASHELLSHIINLKYQQALPLYRQTGYFKMMGAFISRQTLSNWIIGVANALTPIYSQLKLDLLQSDYIQADETTLKVLEVSKKTSKSNCYMWLYKTGNEEKPVLIYEYQDGRGSEHPKHFLKGYQNFLQTDGYAAYATLENVKNIYCLAHIRRKFYEIIEPLSDEARKSSKAQIGFNYCEKLYEIEKEIRTLHKGSSEYWQKREAIRREKSLPIYEEFMLYVKNEFATTLPKSDYGKALKYTIKLLPSFKAIFENGKLEIDNNASERAIKSFVIGRKNFLFSNTRKGANSSALLYSLVETAKANGLIIEYYLTYVMDQIAQTKVIDEDLLKRLVPYSDEIPEYIKLK